MMRHSPTLDELNAAMGDWLAQHDYAPGTMKPPQWAIDAMGPLLAQTGIAPYLGDTLLISEGDLSQLSISIWNLACLAAQRGWDTEPRPVSPEDSEP